MMKMLQYIFQTKEIPNSHRLKLKKKIFQLNFMDSQISLYNTTV